MEKCNINHKKFIFNPPKKSVNKIKYIFIQPKHKYICDYKNKEMNFFIVNILLFHNELGA